MDQMINMGPQLWVFAIVAALLAILFFPLFRNLKNRLRILEAGLHTFETTVNDNFLSIRESIAAERAADREEIGNNLRAMSESVVCVINELSRIQQQQMDSFGGLIRAMSRTNEEHMDRARHDAEARMESIRNNVGKELREYDRQMERMVRILETKLDNDERRADNFHETVSEGISEILKSNEQTLERLLTRMEEKLNRALETRLNESLSRIQKTNEQKLEQMRAMMNEKLYATLLSRFGEGLTQIQKMNERKYEQMCVKMDEKLNTALETRLNESLTRIQKTNEQKFEQTGINVEKILNATLDRRLSESFTSFSDRLDLACASLREIHTPAGFEETTHAPDNIKPCRVWDQVELDNLLEEIMTPDQYVRNVAIVPGCSGLLDYAIRLPGRDASEKSIYLPIDAKFPVEVCQRLLNAMESGDPQKMNEASRMLDETIRNEATRIRHETVQPPYTTDFAIMYLPVEALYTEVLRRDGTIEQLRHEARIVIAGPAALPAVLNGCVEKWSQKLSENRGKRYGRRTRKG